ncbi:MAG: CBS domain-containing protein [Gammaproteobacteria bacterium]|jgi:CBS domain-containing protein
MGTVEHLLANKGYKIWTVTPEETVYNAIKLMADKDVGALPVVLNKNLIGIVSERDYTRKVILQQRHSQDTRVVEIMTRDVFHISPAMGIDECMRIMSKNHFRHLPVVLDGELIGIISILDVVKAVIEEQRDRIEHLEHDISWGESY